MGLKEEVMEMKNEVKKVKKQSENSEHSFAMELIQTQNETNAKKDKRNFIIIMVLIVLLFAETIFMFYTLSDIGTIETTVTQENSDGYNNYIGNDGDINNGKANN